MIKMKTTSEPSWKSQYSSYKTNQEPNIVICCSGKTKKTFLEKSTLLNK